MGGATNSIREGTAVRLPDGTAVLEVGPDVWPLEGDVKGGAAGNALGGVVGNGVGAPDGAAVGFLVAAVKGAEDGIRAGDPVG